MPYLEEEAREMAIDRFVESNGLQEPGDLAYIVAEALDQFVGTQFNYARLAAAVGAVQTTLDEFQRRVVAPYEGLKRQTNGEVFHLSVRGIRNG